jgi:serine/threonine-protein kinase RsbW
MAMRNRTHLPARPRGPNGPPEAAGRPIHRNRIAQPVFDLQIERDGLARLRTAVNLHVSQLGGDGIREDVVLVVHELATNVVRHGGGSGRLRLWRDGRHIVCQVSDSGPGLGPVGDELPGPGTPGGRGLWIARRLADVRIETGLSGTTVVATLKL